MKKIPLHIQIFIALITGAVFGALLNVDQHELNLKYFSKGTETGITVNKWQKITISADDFSKEFGPEDQIGIINYFNKLNKNRSTVEIAVEYNNGEIKDYPRVIKISKSETAATVIKPVGDIFIRLLSFLAIPLVIASLILGAASIKDIKKLGRIGGKTFAIYIMTTAIAITIGLAAANILRPGEKIDENTKTRLLGSYQEDKTGGMVNDMDIDILDFMVNIVPKNPIKAMANGNMLQIVFFAVLFGITLTFIREDKSKPVLDFFDGVSETMIKMVGFIMKIAPYGVFALIAATVANFGFSILSTLIWYIVAVLAGLIIHTLLVYTGLVKFIGKESPAKFFKAMRNAQAIGFSTSSSAATLPVTMDCVENGMGVSKQISGFVLPLGATINMDGTALYQGVAAVFIAQVYGFDLSITAQLTIVLTAVLASIGTAPVPGVGIIMLVLILQAINVPAEGIALILGVDRILDMCRTVTNVTGDAAVAVTVSSGEV